MTNQIKTIMTALLILSAMCVTAAAELPATFDWRDVDGTNYMTPVKHQGGCGSCWAFATMACVESAYKIYIDPTTDLDLSEQYFVSDCYSLGDCSGGFPVDMLTHIKHVGTPSEECFPYVWANSPCTPCDNWQDDACKIEGFLKVDETTLSFKQALYEYGPIVATTSYNHAICVVGWNDLTETWICKDSHGYYNTLPFASIETVEPAYVVTGILKDWTSPVSATASSTWDYTGPPSAAIDRKYEDVGDVWSSDFEVPCWIQFDLGEELSIDAAYLSIGSPRYNPTTFNLSVSTDNVSWTTVAENVVPRVSATMFELPIGTIIARYIRLDIIDAYDKGTCWEFGVIETIYQTGGKGDFDVDFDVDFDDFVGFAGVYGSVIGDGVYNPIGDFDDDGDIDGDDFVEFAGVYEG